MPLVVPGIMSNEGSSSAGGDWLSKLAGKKIGEQHNETVRPLYTLRARVRKLIDVHRLSQRPISPRSTAFSSRIA